jgi:hypothetical protein
VKPKTRTAAMTEPATMPPNAPHERELTWQELENGELGLDVGVRSEPVFVVEEPGK